MVLVSINYDLYFEHWVGSHRVIKYCIVGEKHPDDMKGVTTPESLHMNPKKTDLGPILPVPKVLTTKKLPNIILRAFPKIISYHMKFDIHFPLGEAFNRKNPV